MITTVIVLAAVMAWAVTSRYLFRHWVRNDMIVTGTAARCTCGHRNLHLGRSCHPEGGPASHATVAAIAVSASLFLPVTLFLAFVMARPPLGRRELAEKTRELEAENARLRREQAPGYYDPESWNDPY